MSYSVNLFVNVTCDRCHCDLFQRIELPFAPRSGDTIRLPATNPEDDAHLDVTFGLGLSYSMAIGKFRNQQCVYVNNEYQVEEESHHLGRFGFQLVKVAPE